LLNGVLITGRSNSSGKRCPVVAFASGQHGPDGSRQFIRNRRNDHTVRSARDQSSDPVRVCAPSDDGARAMHQQGTQIGIAALGDAQLPYSSSCACLPRHQPQPGSKFSPRLEACWIPHRSNCSTHLAHGSGHQCGHQHCPSRWCHGQAHLGSTFVCS